MNSGEEGLSSLSFCNTMLNCVDFVLSLELPNKFLYKWAAA